jgi:mono/diheme cytochrome c family protein
MRFGLLVIVIVLVAASAASIQVRIRRGKATKGLAMRSVLVTSVVSASALLIAVFTLGASHAEPPPAPVDYSKVSATDLVKNTPKGKLHNPYKDSQASIVSQGEALFRSYPCSGCHGGNAGGGMCPPLTTSDWIYNGDDDSLFRLVTLGSIELQKRGYTRQGLITSAGPMPPMGPIIKDSDELWKILTFIRSRYDSDPAYKYGTPASQQ